MSSSCRSASPATRAASPAERSSMTLTALPSASSASTTCEPMNPAPPVTIVRGVTPWNLYRRSRGPRGQLLFDGVHGLVDSLEHTHAVALARQASAGGRPAEHDRYVGV